MMAHRIIFKAIVGSRAYGTSTPNSDTDCKGVYIQPPEEILSFKYREQIDIGKDETYYEVRRFIQLLGTANPTVLELLYSPCDCIIKRTKEFDIIVANRKKFLTKKCLQSFGGYAVQQIQKAKGFDKKTNWEKQRAERKTVLDFCYVLKPTSNFDTIPLKDWLKSENKNQKYCGLSKINHFRDCYCLFYDHLAEMKTDNPRFDGSGYGYSGIVKSEENSNDVSLSDIPSFAIRDNILYFNKDAYTIHCNEFKEYQVWLKERNVTRYVETKTHGQKIDGKNILHCRRLLDMAIEIAEKGELVIRRPNAEELIAIRNGDVDLEKIISKAEEDIKKLDSLFEKSSLPEECDAEFINDLLLEVRNFKPHINEPIL